MTPREWAAAGLTVARTFGVQGMLHRARFETRKQLRRLKHEPTPVSEDVRQSAVQGSAFHPDGSVLRAAVDENAALSRAERVRTGEYQRYRWTWVKRPTTPAEWLLNPETGHRYCRETPWYRVAHMDPRAGDIKDVWDPARFGWAFDLIRGWILTGDEEYAACFGRAVDQFLESSPPYRGVHWSCGQETAIRAIAWLWCEAAFDNAESFERASRHRLREALAWSAERIDDALDYAISQRNNHGLSEATGLIALGARFRGIDARAEGWIRRGAACLETLVRDQFATDGWYIQHSFTYTRLALDQLVVARRALRHVGRDLSPACLSRIAAAVHLLASCTEPRTGEVPNHGANDGSFVLPLTTRPYGDFRPSLTAAAVTFGVELPNALDIDPEVLAWLGETSPPRKAVPSLPRVTRGESGWAIAETSGVRVFARAGSYRARPGHIDPGHIDIWLNGIRQAIDAGTYRYLAPPPWRNGLAQIEVHNTVNIDGLPAAVRGPRFLWLRWPKARIVTAGAMENGDIRIVIENLSWQDAGIVHRRTCRVGTENVVVIDELTTPAAFDRTIRVHWLLEDRASVTMWASGDATVSETVGGEDSTLGWSSEGYGERRPVRSLRLEARAHNGRVRVISAFGRPAPVADSSIRDERMITCA
jgi:heparinase II/III-like protein